METYGNNYSRMGIIRVIATIYAKYLFSDPPAQIHEMFMDIGNDGLKDGHCSLRGVLGSLFNLKISKLIRRGFRCQLIPGQTLGQHNQTSNSYNGLLGMLQRGNLDSVAIPVFYPLNDTKDIFSYSPPLVEDTMTLFSAYNTTTETHVGDIFTMFSSVPHELWLGMFVCFLALASVTSVANRLLGKSHSGIWASICAFLDQDIHQDYYPVDARYFVILLSILTCGLFFVVSYRDGCLSTDLVTTDPPVVVDSYDYIIENNIQTGFSRMTAEWEKFEMAPKGSKERKMFENSFSTSFSRASFLELLSGLITQKRVIVGRPFIARLTAMSHLASPTWPSKGYAAYVAPDKYAKKYSTVFVSDTKHKSSPLTKYSDKLTKWMSQHGIVNYAAGDHVILLVLDQLYGEDSLPMSKRNMVTSHVESPQTDVIDIGLPQFSRLIVVISVFITFGLIILIIEISCHHCFVLEQVNIQRHNRTVTPSAKKLSEKILISSGLIKFKQKK